VVGAFESGTVARSFGPVFSVVGVGFKKMEVGGFVALAFPALRRLKRVDETKDDVRQAEYEEEEHRRLGPQG